MNKKQVLANLAAIANRLDEHSVHDGADALTQIMRRISQKAWWENDAGEPMYSPEAIRKEEEYRFDPDFDFDSGDERDIEMEEPRYKAPTTGLLQTVEQILGKPAGTPFIRGYGWGALSDSIAFETHDDLMKVVGWLRQNPEYDNEWESYRDRSPFQITMPEDSSDNVQAYAPSVEDFGHFGDERFMGE